MWKLFRKAPLLSEESSNFQVECFQWLLTHFGGDDFHKDTQLVLPTDEFFPAEECSNGLSTESVFHKVKKYAGLDDWPVNLVAQEDDSSNLVAPTLLIRNTEENPFGTISENEDGQVTISYNPKVEADPTQMIATFAHELSHYLTSSAPEPPPGGWENWEYATDICSTFLGFGIFMANSTFSFKQFSNDQTIGWETSGGGYLSEAEHSYALAIFLGLKGIEPKTALPFCDTNIKGYLKQSIKELEATNIIDELKSVAFIPSDKSVK